MQASAAISDHRRAREGFFHHFLRLFLFVDALSLLAPLVAVAWQVTLSRCWQIPLSPLEPLALALAIWSLYAADHMFDALRPRSSYWEPGRKTFHRAHWPIMALIAFCSGASSFAIALTRLSRGTFLSGLAIGAFVLLYFLSIHSGPFWWRGLWPREAVVALGFGLGTFMPLVRPGTFPSRTLLAASAVFALLCWLNCCAVETWEWQRSGSPAEEKPHISTRWIACHLSTLAICVGTGALLLGGYWGRGNELGLAGFSSGTALFVLAQVQTGFSDSILGVTADLALCVPLLFFAVR